MRLSVIIPTWQEADQVCDAVKSAACFADEVIVADSASPDGTAEKAKAAGAAVVIAPRGRGQQLAAGAKGATGDVFLFLHADARLPMGAREAISKALQSPEIVAGNFMLSFDTTTRAARFMSWANDVRRRWLRIYYGDSALFVRRVTYEALGGYAQIPLFEDYEFVRRLERQGNTAYVRHISVTASSRRFAGAPLRTLGVWTLLQCLYSLGVPPARLAKLYRDLR